MKKIDIQDKFKQKISELKALLFPHQEGEVWLYGSRARGDNHSDSDWDLLVLTNDYPDNFFNFKKYAFPFISLGIEFNQDVRPILYSKDQWEKENKTLFHINVLKDHVKL